jgi:hypothetical protein
MPGLKGFSKAILNRGRIVAKGNESRVMIVVKQTDPQAGVQVKRFIWKIQISRFSGRRNRSGHFVMLSAPARFNENPWLNILAFFWHRQVAEPEIDKTFL